MRGEIISRGILALCLAVTVSLFPLAAPGKAGAITLGQVAPSASVCDAGNYVQVGATTAPYTVPAPGGVITSWSHHGKSAPAGAGRLQVWRRVPGTGDFTLVGRSAIQPFAAGVVNSFPTEIPVSAGDRLGMHVGDSNTGCAGPGGLGDAVALSPFATSGDPSPGAVVGMAVQPFAALLNVSAELELPPSDGDPGPGDTEPGDPGPGDPDAPGAPGIGPLTLDLHAKKQKLKKALVFFATASADSALLARGKAIKKATKQLTANQGTKVKAKLKRKARKRLARKLAKKGRANTKLRATATDRSGATAHDTVRIRLRG
jgi:hypothetical protein